MTSADVSVGVPSLPMKFSAMLFHPERRATRTLVSRRIAGDNRRSRNLSEWDTMVNEAFR